MPDSIELAPTRDPSAYAKRPLLTGGFWVMMAFCALCLLAAAAVVILAPRLAPVRHAVVAASPTATPPPATRPLAAELAPPVDTSAPTDVSALSGRLQRLESSQDHILNAAAGALAASALSDAAAKPAPFAADLAAVAKVLPGSPDATALASLAQEGAPTRPALATDLTALGAEISTAARAPGRNASFMDRALYAVARVVSLRRIDVKASGPDAILVRAQHRADDGDLEGAVATLDTLPDEAKAALAPGATRPSAGSRSISTSPLCAPRRWPIWRPPRRGARRRDPHRRRRLPGQPAHRHRHLPAGRSRGGQPDLARLAGGHHRRRRGADHRPAGPGRDHLLARPGVAGGGPEAGRARAGRGAPPARPRP